MDYLQALAEVRPGFAFSELTGSDATTVRVVGERASQVLLRGGESPGWWSRSDIAEAVSGTGPRDALVARARCRQA